MTFVRETPVAELTQPKLAALEAGRRKRKVSWKIDEIQQELLWRKWFPQVDGDWSRDLTSAQVTVLHEACVSFLESNMWIKVPGRGKVMLKLRGAQLETLRDWIANRYTVALKARQIGFSTLASGFALWLTFGWSDRQVAMVSKGEREAISLLRKAKDAYKNMPEWVKMRGPRLMDRTRQVMTFENDSVIGSFPSASDPIRGESVFLVIVDEWASLPNPEDAWASIEPATDIGGKVIGLSTARGEGNFFHRLWLGAENQTNQFVGIFHPWSAVPERDAVWRAEKERTMEPWLLAQEYPSTPEEAFVGSGNPFFNLVNLARFTPEDPVFEGTITLDKKLPILWEGGGEFTIWEMPNDQDKWSYVVGADIAQGLDYGDFTVAYVLCVQTNEIVACWHGHMDPDVFGEEVLPAIGKYYRYAVVAPEFNNHGMTVVKALQRAKYGRIYRRRSLSRRHDRPLEQLGWLTTQTSKPLLADELAMWLREVDNIPDKATVSELRSFSRDAKGKLAGQPHDDRVMALGIAVQARKYAITEKIGGGEKAENVKGTYAWWERRLGGVHESRKGLRPSLM